jgi:hypothetical protein
MHRGLQLFPRSIIDGVRQRVLARDFQIHPFKPKAICINWLRYREGAYPGARIEIPLKTFNDERCPALKEGGWLLELTHKVRPLRLTSALLRHFTTALYVCAASCIRERR